jgi:hypothetical protein
MHHTAPRFAMKGRMLAAAALLVAATLLGAGCATTGPRPGAVRQVQALDPAFAQARELARNDASLAGSAKAENARQIDRLLAGLDDAVLQRDAAALPAGDPLYNFAGRALLRRGLPLPRPFDRGAWRLDGSDRPAADRDGYRPPLRMAVLLPLTGSRAAAAAPVRDGLLAGYYGETRRRPEIRFYDTAGTPDGALAAYAKAAGEGNDFVLGPLGRDEVGALFQQGRLPVPVLALNRGTTAPPAGSASFSLSPEEEGVAAADFLVARKARRALVVSGRDDGARRAAAAFAERFAERGGRVVATLDVGDPVEDLSAGLAAATKADGGVDAVFLPLKGSQARAVAPQLDTAGLAGKPRVGTSQLTSGTGKPAQDRVLDGIAFPTETWTARGVAALPSAASVGTRLKSARGAAARLFAFGYDAWLLAAYLEHLALHADGEVRGATGTLRIDGFGNVLRTPSWSAFAAGAPAPLADAPAR